VHRALPKGVSGEGTGFVRVVPAGGCGTWNLSGRDSRPWAAFEHALWAQPRDVARIVWRSRKGSRVWASPQ
jgi:hypothetical protein